MTQRNVVNNDYMKGFFPPSDNDFATFQLTGVFVGWWGDLPASRTNAEFYRLQATKQGGAYIIKSRFDRSRL